MSKEGPAAEGDALTDAVYRKAFPNADERDPTLMYGRRTVIRDRLGVYPPDDQAKQKRQTVLRDISQVGFTKSMMRLLARERSLSELVLFFAHASSVFHENLGRASAVPASLASIPSFAGTFNQAMMMLKDDIEAIDDAIKAVTGRLPRSGNRGR